MIRMNCHCGVRPVWVEMGPGSHNRYSVRCSKCEKQAKWGGMAEFERLMGEGEDVLVRTYAEQIAEPPDPFAPFMKE